MNNYGRRSQTERIKYTNRNRIERRYCHIKQWRCLATRYDKHATVYRAAVLINATIASA